MRNSMVISITFLMAFVLTLLPMPDWAIWFRPAWILMVLIYWVIALPYRVNVGAAWIVGIILDILNGSMLGEHALALTVVTYLMASRYSQFRMSPLLQQSLVIFFLVLIYLFLLYCLQGFIQSQPKTWLYWVPALTSMLLWPWVFFILRDCRRRFKVA